MLIGGNIKYIFLIDHTVINDYFRDNYPHSDVADCLIRYTHNRNTFISNEKIIIIPELIFNKVQYEFPIYYGITPAVITTLCKIIDIFPVKNIESDNNLKIMIIVANALLSKDIIPIIISSINKKKIHDEFHRWGLEVGLDGVTEVMSKQRIFDKFPCFLIDTKKTGAKKKLIDTLSEYDSEYVKISKFDPIN